MSTLRRSLLRVTRLALWLALVIVLVPSVSRLVAVSDPVRAAMLAEVCAVVNPAERSADTGLPGEIFSASHCPLCLTPVLPPVWPPRSTVADFDRPVVRLRPVVETLLVPRPSSVWRLVPSRAPPVTA